MPLTAIDPNTALVVIGLQKGVAAAPVVHQENEIVHRAAALASAFRKHRMPVVLVNVAGIAPGRIEVGPAPLGPPEGWTGILPEPASTTTESRSCAGSRSTTRRWTRSCGNWGSHRSC